MIGRLAEAIKWKMALWKVGDGLLGQSAGKDALQMEADSSRFFFIFFGQTF
jgi:hypothetical protein